MAALILTQQQAKAVVTALAAINSASICAATRLTFVSDVKGQVERILVDELDSDLIRVGYRLMDGGQQERHNGIAAFAAAYGIA